MSKLSHSDTNFMRALDIRRMIDNGEIVLSEIGSSNIRRAGHHRDEQLLVLEFPTGQYAYDGVSPDVFAKFMAAESKGSFFARNIRSVFPTLKLPSPEHEELAAV